MQNYKYYDNIDFFVEYIKLFKEKLIDKNEEEIYKDFELFKDIINHIEEEDISNYQNQ